MRTALLFALAAAFAATTLSADTHSPVKQTVLDAITARGKMLAEYDKAAASASDAVQKTKPGDDRVTRYVAIKEPIGWKVLFGRLDKRKSGFLVAYEAVSEDNSLAAFNVTTNDPPVSVSGFPLNAVKAMETALAKFSFDEQRAYNIAALPADRGQLWVYIYPAQTNSDIWPLGGDARFLISPNGEKIIATRQLHGNIIDFASPPPGTKIESGYHTAVSGNVPEDTDVLYVLNRRPSVKEFVATQKFVFLIQTDGSITYQGTRPEFGKRGGIPR